MYERWHEVVDLSSREAELAERARWAPMRREAELARGERRVAVADGGRLDRSVRRVLRVAQAAAGFFA